jgi:CheY-like chemotaxis protein
VKEQRLALLLEDRPGSLDHVARALAPVVCDVKTAAAAAGLPDHDPGAVDLVLLETDLPPVRGLRLLHHLKQEPTWRWVPVVVIYPHEPCDEHLFAVWANGPDMQVWDTPEESAVTFLRKWLPRMWKYLPSRSAREARASAHDAPQP